MWNAFKDRYTFHWRLFSRLHAVFQSFTFFAFPRFVFGTFIFRRNEGRSTGVKWILCTLEILCMALYLSCRAFWRLGESWISGGDHFSVLSFFIYICVSFFLAFSASLFTFSLKPSAIKKNAFSSNKIAKGSSPKKSLREFISFCRKSPFFCDTLQFTTWWAAVLFWHRWLTRACYRSLTSHIRDLYNPINPLDKLSSRPSLKLNSNGLILIKLKSAVSYFTLVKSSNLTSDLYQK